MPEIYVTRSDLPPFEEYVKEISQMWETFHLTNNGALHNKLQNELEKYLSVKNAILFCNGHLALSYTIRAFNLSGEVITTPFTFASTTHAIVENNLTPVFCDISPSDCTIDPDKIESLITEKTSAILAVHVYGNICDTEAIDKIAKKYNLKVIYDAAHAFGVLKNGVGVGCFGDASMFSFHATKVFHTIEGGCITFNDDSFKETLKRIKNFGILAGVDADVTLGGNAKMNEFSAAMGLCNLRHIEQNMHKRKQVHDKYFSLLSNLHGVRILANYSSDSANYSYMPVLFDRDKLGFDRNDVFESLAKANIFARKYFYPLTNDFSCYRNQFPSSTPVAQRISENLLCLPMYADLPLEDVELVCKIIGRRHN